MPFLEFLFSPQAHKFRNGYNINHDTLLNVSEEARRKLIFYFIAEQLPQKLEPQDRQAYEAERTSHIGLPRALWMVAGLMAPVVHTIYRRPANGRNIRKLAWAALQGGLLSTFAVALHERVYEGRFVESSEVISNLARKYNYGIWDFAVAKKESHILSLLYTMDAPYEALHS